MADDEKYISNKDTLARLVRLETKLCIKFEEMDKALILARESSTRDTELAMSQLNHRLEGMNQFQRRMDKLEGTFATKDQLDQIRKLVYIGVGLVLALEVALRFIIK